MGTWNASKKNIAIGLLAMVLSTAVHAQSKAPSAPAPGNKGEDKVDISDLENKYWAPKDTDFSVVQNRTYTKEKRFFLAPQWGMPINDPYSEGNVYGVTLNYFWSERMGVQAMGFKASLTDNDPSRDIQSLGTGAMPNHGKLSSYMGVGFNFVPFYAKMSFWGKKIIYFDMAFTPTIGVTTYEQQFKTLPKSEKSAFTYGLDITQFFFFSNYFAVRADLKNQFHAEEIRSAANNSVQGEKLKDKMTQDTLFLIGLMFFY